MTTIEDLIDTIYTYAYEQAPIEACGLVAIVGGKLKFFPCFNELSSTEHFSIGGKAYADIEDLGTIVYIVHSHPRSLPEPSEVDKASLELDNIPWLIVNPFLKTYTITNPTGYIAPLIGRTYTHGVLDCYTIIRDYYKQEVGLELTNYKRDDLWWELGHNLYNIGYPKEGFQDVLDGTIKLHDIIIMRIASSTENHAAIYVGNNKILHHPMGRYSTEDIYGGWWQKITSKVIRHKSLL